MEINVPNFPFMMRICDDDKRVMTCVIIKSQTLEDCHVDLLHEITSYHPLLVW